MRVLHSRVSHGSLGVSRLEGSRGRVIRCVLAEFAHVHTWSNLIFQNYDDSYGLSTRDQEVQWYLFNTLECSNFDVLGCRHGHSNVQSSQILELYCLFELEKPSNR